MQAAFAVIQTIAKPELVTSGISFIMIGKQLIDALIPLPAQERVRIDTHRNLVAQLLSVSLALSISGAIFVNRASSGLEHILVGFPREEIQAALLGLSGDFLATLDPAQKTEVLNVIVHSLSKV